MNRAPFILIASLLVLASPLAAAEKDVQPFKGVTLGEQSFDLGDYLGKVPILLDFGSIYCSSCVTSIPHLINLQNRYGEERLRVVGVDLDTYGVSRVRRFFASYGERLNFPVILDLDLEISRSFGVNTLPTYILIDREGKIAATFVGFNEENQRHMDEAVREVVEEGAVAGQMKQVVQNVVILSPDNFTKSYQDSISVVGLTGGRSGPFVLSLNGGSDRTASISGKMFWVRTPLSLGSNYIEIKYLDGGSTATQALIMFREPVMGEGLDIQFPEFQFHTPDHEERCTPCHKFDAEAAGENTLMTTFCLRCHDYLTSETWVHGPIPVGGCSPCHDFSSKPHKYDLVSVGSDLCFTCHADIQEKFAKPYVHGPVAMGFCTVCHSPHSSPFKFQVRLPQGDLCMSCHEDMKAKAAALVQHKPFEEGRCAGCHDPHASDNPTHFLKGEGQDLCALCHDEDAMAGHKHPVGRPPKFTVAGMELGEDGNLVCRTCHDPHASDSDRMSPVAGGCAGCHQM